MKKIADLHVHMSNIEFEKCTPYLDLLESQGVTDVALQSLTYRSIIYNLMILYWKHSYKKMNIAAFGMIHNQDRYRDIPFETQVKALLDMGCDGIKLMNAPGSRKRIGFGLDDPRYDEMFSYLEENQIPILIHVADPEEFWIPRELTELEKKRGWGYFDGTYLSKQELYDETFRMLDKHPRLRVTFAHFFFLSNFIDEAVHVMESYPNVGFDITPGWEMFLGFSKNIDAWQAFFEKYADRIYFGTDCNNTKDINPAIYQLVRTAISHDKSEFQMPCYAKCMIKGLDLSKSACNKITYENYVKFVGTPKEVNMTAVTDAAKKIYSDIKDSNDEMLVRDAAWLSEFFKRTNDE